MTIATTSIHTQHKIISMEAGAFSQTLEALPQKLPGFVADVKNHINSLMGGDAPRIEFVKEDRDVTKHFRQIDYANLMPVKAYIPSGLSCSYLDYIKVLEHNQSIVDELIEKTLQPALRWVAELNMDPEKLASVTGTRAFREITFHDLEAAKKRNADCFQNTDVTDEATIGEVINRNKDWLEVLKGVRELNERNASVDRGKVVELITEITSALEKLFSTVEEENEAYRLSGKNMKDIANVTYNLAQEVEFYAVHSFQLQGMTQAVRDTQEHLGDKLK